ncbi:MAG: lysylphosphatidylglycerol synthase domain-containing protein [Pseudomonadota bacterium]
MLVHQQVACDDIAGSSNANLKGLSSSRLLMLTIRLTVAGVIFWIIAQNVDVMSALHRLADADPSIFAFATGLILFQHIFTAARWRLISKTQGQPIPFTTAILAYVEANFFNQSLPSTIGGDAIRVLRGKRSGQSLGGAIVSVFVDRAVGLLALSLMVIYSAVLIAGLPSGELTSQVLAITVGLAIISAIVGSLLSSIFPWLAKYSLTKPLYYISDGAGRVLKKPAIAFPTLAYSLIGHSITVFAFYLLARSLDIQLDLAASFVVLPAILLASAIPLSINGWGIRESVSVIIMGHLGILPEPALALSIIFGLSLFFIGLIGGFIWLTGSIAGTQNDAGSVKHTLSGDRQAFTDSIPAESEQPQKEGSRSAGHRTDSSTRKSDILAHAERSSTKRDKWIASNRTYFNDDRAYMRFLVNENSRVLDLGCSTGELLARLNPSYGLGIDFSPGMIQIARQNNPDLDLRVGDVEDKNTIEQIDGTFDYVIMSDTIGLLDDIEVSLVQLHKFFTPETRLVIAYYSHLWEPFIYIAEKLGFRPRQPRANFITDTDFANLLHLADFELVRSEMRQLIPARLLGIGPLINRFIATLPLIRKLCLRRYIVARSLRAQKNEQLSVSILVPCRNERGNIEPIVKRMPRFGTHQEIVFIEGNSRDGTYDECLRIKDKYADEWDIQVLQQAGKGKGDAMRKGYAAAKCDVIMILDADMTVPPETLPRFYNAIAFGKGEFINGSRLIYPMENEAMRPLNLIANRIFAWLFSYLLNQRFTDTLCGTKVFKRSTYNRIADNRSYFGEFDPFGDFDLIFGASKQSLRIVEVPVHYKARIYGETQISRFRDGFLLLRMVIFAWRKLKAI